MIKKFGKQNTFIVTEELGQNKTNKRLPLVRGEEHVIVKQQQEKLGFY